MESSPDRTQIIELVAKQMYSDRVLNNSHRGEVVEMMVLSALGAGWNHVGLGWHPWDLEWAKDVRRVRIQVKQTAARQLWGLTKTRALECPWKSNPPSYFLRDNPSSSIESEGRFCELYVFGIHDETDDLLIDQVDPRQWDFMVIPTAEILRETNQIPLAKARDQWETVKWHQLRLEVEKYL